MSDQKKHANLMWCDDRIPVSVQFDDPYFSFDNGLEETRYVFLSANDLPKRFARGFQIAELGFGSGLNLLAAWQAWEQSNAIGPLRFTSFEAFPMALGDMKKAQSHWPELASYSERFFAGWNGVTGLIETQGLIGRVVFGDARETLPNWSEKADAWFLDGFSPAKNPELWEPSLLKAVGEHTNFGGTVATYTAAGHVRQALATAGFEVTRAKGFGRKRHMTRGFLKNEQSHDC